jgi:hypothetical protein
VLTKWLLFSQVLPFVPAVSRRDVAWPEHPSILGSQNRRDHRLPQQSLSQLSRRRGEWARQGQRRPPDRLARPAARRGGEPRAMSSVLHHGGDGRRPARPGILGSRCPRTSNLRGQLGMGPVWRSAEGPPFCDEEITGCTDRADPKSTRHKYCDRITLQAGGLGSGAHGDTALRSRVTRPPL